MGEEGYKTNACAATARSGNSGGVSWSGYERGGGSQQRGQSSPGAIILPRTAMRVEACELQGNVGYKFREKRKGRTGVISLVLKKSCESANQIWNAPSAQNNGVAIGVSKTQKEKSSDEA